MEKTSKATIYQKPILLQVRLELTTPAWLDFFTDYKYRALTDCATGAAVHK